MTITGIGRFTEVLTAEFTIEKASQIITVEPSEASVAVGKAISLSTDGNQGKISYSSSDPSVASVTRKGRVQARKVGTVTVTATAAETDNYQTGSKTITVKVVPAPVKHLKAFNFKKGIMLSWTKAKGAEGYVIFRNGKEIKTINDGKTLTYLDTTGLLRGGKYVYQVAAKADTGISPLSRSATVYRLWIPGFFFLK